MEKIDRKSKLLIPRLFQPDTGAAGEACFLVADKAYAFRLHGRLKLKDNDAPESGLSAREVMIGDSPPEHLVRHSFLHSPLSMAINVATQYKIAH